MQKRPQGSGQKPTYRHAPRRRPDAVRAPEETRRPAAARPPAVTRRPAVARTSAPPGPRAVRSPAYPGGPASRHCRRCPARLRACGTKDPFSKRTRTASCRCAKSIPQSHSMICGSRAARVIGGGESSSPSGRLRRRWLMASSIMAAALLSTFAFPMLLRAFGSRLQRVIRLMSSKYASTVAGRSPTPQTANRDAVQRNAREQRTPGTAGRERTRGEAHRKRRADLIRKQVADRVSGCLVLGGNCVCIGV